MGFFLVTHPVGGTPVARNKSPQAVPQPCLFLTLLLSSSLKFCLLRRITHIRPQADLLLQASTPTCPWIVLLVLWNPHRLDNIWPWPWNASPWLPQHPPPMLFPVPLWLSCICFPSSTCLENIRMSKISSLPSSSQRWSRVAPSLSFLQVPQLQITELSSFGVHYLGRVLYLKYIRGLLPVCIWYKVRF